VFVANIDSYGHIDNPAAASYFFNERRVTGNNFKWAYDDLNDPYLMILIDAANASGGENANLTLPVYGKPVVNKSGNDFSIKWIKPGNSNDWVTLTFRENDLYMTVNRSERGYASDIPLSVGPIGDSSGSRLYVPIYAIANEVDGGILINPLGDGTHFIFTGERITGYTGMWETSDRGEYRADAVIDGKTHSISSYWTGLELRADGTFTESNRFYQDSGDWVLVERKGRYAFAGRILVMDYKTESEARGADYNALKPRKIDGPVELYGMTPGVYARYVEDWDDTYLSISGYDGLYSILRQTGEAAPLPGKATQ
jgi:hypothetical protein